MWDLSFTTIWPQVMIVLEPFGPLFALIATIAVAGLVLGLAIRVLTK